MPRPPRMTSTTRVAALTVLSMFAAACAASSSQTPVPDGGERRAMFVSPNTPTVYTAPTTGTTRSIVGEVSAVRSIVRQVYADYEVPLTLDDTVTQQMGNREFYKSVKFAGKRMTELVNCGTGMTGPNAATYRIYMSLITRVTPETAKRTSVSTTLVASARDMSSGATADRITCGSTGVLEQLMLTRISTLSGE